MRARLHRHFETVEVSMSDTLWTRTRRRHLSETSGRARIGFWVKTVWYKAGTRQGSFFFFFKILNLAGFGFKLLEPETRFPINLPVHPPSSQFSIGRQTEGKTLPLLRSSSHPLLCSPSLSPPFTLSSLSSAAIAGSVSQPQFRVFPPFQFCFVLFYLS